MLFNGWKCGRVLLWACVCAVGCVGVNRAYAADLTVFDSVPAELIPVIREGVPAGDGPLRRLTVAERVGLPRTGELVRVPLFFHPGECADPQGLTIYDLSDPTRKPIPYQADDIRKDADGREVARMHVYFYADLKSWERKQFAVIKGKNPAADLPAVSMQESGDGVTFKGDDITVGFVTKGATAGAVTKLETRFGKLNLLDRFVAPEVRLVRQNSKCAVLRRTELKYSEPDKFEIREIKCAAGPLFGKLRVKIGPVGVPDSAETTYMIPKSGSLLFITQRTFPEDPETGDVVASEWPVLLGGRVTFGDSAEAATSIDVPTGLRKILRETQKQKVEAVIAPASGFSVINVPIVSNGGEIHYQTEDPAPQNDPKKSPPKAKFTMHYMGPGTLKREGSGNSGSIRAFWTQSRMVFAQTTDPEKIWNAVRSGQNGLTAIVDEPGLTIEDLGEQFARNGKLFYDIKHWGRGWQQDAAMAYLTGNDEGVKRLLENQAKTPTKIDPRRGDPATLEGWIPNWVKEQMEAADFKPPLQAPKDFQWKNIALDPYNQGYANSSIVPYAMYLGPSERLDKMCYAIGRGSMLTNGQVYPEGFPYIKSFANAYNMQIGSVYFGIYSGKKLNDPWMTLFYRDINKANGTANIYGHGERAYSGNMGQGATSDVLYQAISDLWLRAIELVCNENLSIHPAAYARFTDTIDVTSDLQHHTLTPETHWSQYRGNFFRGQQHDHRWESWDAMPYLILQEYADEEVPAGITEAIYYSKRQADELIRLGKQPNWSTLMNFFHPMFNLRVARHNYAPPTLPALPGDVKVVSAGTGGVRITWSPVEGAVGYRVYRSDRIGLPLTFLNSPYVPGRRAELIQDTSYDDPVGSPEMFYFVTAVDKAGFESSWFPDEPTPRPGRNVR